MIALASTSVTRQRLLTWAGVDFLAVSPDVDEAAVKTAGSEPAAVALCLAGLKALTVSSGHPGRLVIGADQMLDCEGRCFDKPNDRSMAKSQLLHLRGRQHRLSTAVAVAIPGQGVVWSHCEEARLTMRGFSDDFADSYLAQAGDAVLSSVGAYQLEGLGAQLFSRVEGDFFSILGLPLLPLLEFLRLQGELPS